MVAAKGNNTMTDTLPFLIIGLGNPGKEYAANRHNIGFMAIDAFAKQYRIINMKVQAKAIVYSGSLNGHKVILAKPQTFMNLSGQSVQALVNFYKLPLENIIIVHDDLDLPFGVLRIRPEGGAGGQNGIRSIIEKLGTNIFPRMRLGIDRPPGRMDAAAYVLQDFNKDQAEVLPTLLDKAVDGLNTWLLAGITEAMNKFNNK